MKTTTKNEDRAKGDQQRAERGAPSTHAAHAVRKDVTVRVSVKAPSPQDGDEQPEHGYGHGV